MRHWRDRVTPTAVGVPIGGRRRAVGLRREELATDIVSSRIAPSVQRLLDRLAHTPVVVHDATWTVIVANAPYDALMGQTTSWCGIKRNSIWRNLVGPGTRAVHTAAEHADFEAGWLPTCG